MGETKAKNKKQNLEADNVLPTDLIATTVHELKSPLTLINGLASMLSEGDFGDVTKKQSQYLRRIVNSSDRLLTLADNLIAIGKLKRDKLPLEVEPISLSHTLKQVIHELTPRLRERQLSVTVPNHHGLPPVLADKTSLYQIIFNLLDNAIKYSPDRAHIKMRYSKDTPFLTLHVQDEGVGVRPSEMNKIFEQFGKAKQPLAAHAGSSGLGLFIVKTLLDVQGGKINVQPLKKGSCFHFSLPIAQQLTLFDGGEGEEASS